MDKLWVIQKINSWQADESSGIDVVEDFVYKGTEESVKQLVKQYGCISGCDGAYEYREYLSYKEYKYPKIWTTIPESYIRK